MRSFFLGVMLLLTLSCGSKAQGTKVTMALNWVPEPEFGGIYAAKMMGEFARNGLDVDIKPGGAGAPTWQRVAQGQVQFAVSSADEVVIARSSGADVVAIFTIYQTCPQGIMVHKSRGLTAIDQVFKSGTLALEVGLPYGKYLQKKYGFNGVKTVPYTGGIANFLADKSFAQQCFIFSEPLSAKKQGADPQVFLVADSGYNPYTGVIITSGKYLNDNRNVVQAMVKSLQAGWTAYQMDPKPANGVMAPLNKNMDLETFTAAAEAQKPLVESDDTKANGIGYMSLKRWEELVKQLTDLGVITKPVTAQQCFVSILPNDGK